MACTAKLGRQPLRQQRRQHTCGILGSNYSEDVAQDK